MPMPKTMKTRGADKSEINRSQAIREAAAEMKGKPRPRDVIAVLAEKGIPVSASLVTNVLRRPRRRKASAARSARRARRASESIVLSSLVEAKRLVDQTGSVRDAKKALDALSKLL
jgi:hypothetical protein